MENKRVSSVLPKLWDREIGRGAFYVQRSIIVRCCGEHRKANVGISNDKRGKKPLHRKTKVSSATLNV